VLFGVISALSWCSSIAESRSVPAWAQAELANLHLIGHAGSAEPGAH
jgi:hypothetical protein